MFFVHTLLGFIGFMSMTLAACYVVPTLIAAALWRHRRISAPPPGPQPVTVLKPLCSAEPGLYEHLRTFCQQDFPKFQIVFGVRDPTDPALIAVRATQKRIVAVVLGFVVCTPCYDLLPTTTSNPALDHDSLASSGTSAIRGFLDRLESFTSVDV